MNIILENEVTEQIGDKYILLELDTFLRTSNGKRVKSYAVVSRDDIAEIDWYAEEVINKTK